MDETSIAWIAGAVFSLIGWGTLVHFAWIVRNWPAAEGHVVGNIAEWAHGDPDMARSAVYFPEIEFDAGGRLHRAKGGVGKRREWQIGTLVKLHYKPANPDHLLDLNRWQRLLFSRARSSRSAALRCSRRRAGSAEPGAGQYSAGQRAGEVDKTDTLSSAPRARKPAGTSRFRGGTRS